MKKRWIITGLVLVPLVAGVIVFSLSANRHKSTEHDNGTTAATPNHERLSSPGETNTTSPSHPVTQVQHQTIQQQTIKTTAEYTTQPQHTNNQTVHATISIITMLLLTPDELPLECVLSDFHIGKNVRISFDSLDSVDKVEMMFDGQMRKNGNYMTSESSINIAYAIAKTPAEAIDIAKRQALTNSEVVPETIPGEKYTDLIDKAWGRRGRYIYVKDNIICDIFIYRREGIDDELTTLIELTANKIAKYCEGKLVPVTFIPLGSDELHQPIQASWDERNIGNTLWGKQSMVLGIIKEGVPREIPAKQLGGNNDYQTSLKYVAAILDPQARVKIKANTATVTLLGKAISLTAGESEVTCDGKAVKIAAPVDIKSGQVLVPLSMLDATVGKPIAWRKEGERIIGSF